MKDIKTLISDLKNLEVEEKILEYSRLELAIVKGQLLLAIKAAVSHGQFASVLKNYGCTTSLRTAQRQMKLAINEDLLKSKATDLTQITIDQALRLLKKETNKDKKEEAPKESFELSYRTSFIPLIQSYEITVLIPSEGIQSMAQKKNLNGLISNLNTIINQIHQAPGLTDLTVLSKN